MPAPASQDSVRHDRISWTPSSALSVKVRYLAQPFSFLFYYFPRDLAAITFLCNNALFFFFFFFLEQI
jgi:hypothetical protein